jgi:membrane protein YdbS with pleckstrin-like domain
MALIKCKECDREISEKATTCPGCGAPVDAKADAPETELLRTRRALSNQPLYFGLLILATLAVPILPLVFHALWHNSRLTLISFIVLAILGLPLPAVHWLRCFRTRLTISTRRVIFTEGIWAVTTTEILLRDIREVQVRQTVFQRLVGTGDLVISSAASGEAEITIEGIRDPRSVASAINDHR